MFISSSQQPSEELLFLPGRLPFTLIHHQSILPTVVRRILLQPKSDPVTEPHSNHPWLHVTLSTDSTGSYKDQHDLLPLTFTSLTSCPPTLLQSHSSLVLPQGCQTHSHLRVFALASLSAWNALLSETCIAGSFHQIPRPSVCTQLSPPQRSPP